MALEGKPVSLTQVAAEDHDGLNPTPLKVVGDIPGVISAVDIPDVPASFADEAAVRTYLLSLVAALKGE